jgi:ABC-type phosphonate transport system ATPase subunit
MASSEAAGHLLAMRDLSKRFGGMQALLDVGIEISVGEIVALLGENGARQINADIPRLCSDRLIQIGMGWGRDADVRAPGRKHGRADLGGA